MGKKKTVPLNLPVYDQQMIHFGMALGTGTMDFTIHNSAIFNTLDSVYSVESVRKPSLDINIVSKTMCISNSSLPYHLKHCVVSYFW